MPYNHSSFMMDIRYFAISSLFQCKYCFISDIRTKRQSGMVALSILKHTNKRS